MKPVVAIDMDGPDGNIFAVMGAAARALRKANLSGEKEMQNRVMSSGSYEEALNIIEEYVELDGR